MKVKQTIAFIGGMGDANRHLLRDLAEADYPVLWVREAERPENAGADIPAEIFSDNIEVVCCAREGCWQADVIMLEHPMDGEAGLWSKIREVANQKIVVVVCPHEISSSDLVEERAAFRRLLPHAQWVHATHYATVKEIELVGAEEAAADIAGIFRIARYQVNLPERADHS